MGLIDHLEGIEFLIALGSIVGLLGLVIGIIFFLIGGSRLRMRMIRVILISIVLVSVCGLYTGKQYFRV